MVQLTDKNPNRNENPRGVHPEVEVVSVKTYDASCFGLVFTNKAIEQETSTRTWKMTYIRVTFSIHHVEREFTNPQSTVNAAMTPTVCSSVGTYCLSVAIEMAASRICAEPYSEDAIPAT